MHILRLLDTSSNDIYKQEYQLQSIGIDGSYYVHTSKRTTHVHTYSAAAMRASPL